MNKICKVIILLTLVYHSSSFSFTGIHWTGEISWIFVDENGTAQIGVSNPRNGPSAEASLGCSDHNILYLGTQGAAVNSSLLSQAMMVYTTGKTMRFGVKGEGSCELYYITAQ